VGSVGGGGPSGQPLSRGGVSFGEPLFLWRGRIRSILRPLLSSFLLFPGDALFEFLTYQPDGKIVAYHGNNG